MKILFATAELDPFSKVGGLADVASALPKRLYGSGHDVRIIVPAHATPHLDFDSLPVVCDFEVRDYGQNLPFLIREARGTGGVPVWFADCPRVFRRAAVYGDADDLFRYLAFTRAVLETIKSGGWLPDILHLNDWHTAPAAFALENYKLGNPSMRGIASVFTIHNLRHKGPEGLTDFMVQGIYHADVVSTVSPTYAREIQTPEYGEGLDALLRLRGEQLYGILNGIDYDVFNPRTDNSIPQTYDESSLQERQVTKAALQDELGLARDVAVPLFGMVSRMTEQKGFDLLEGALDEVLGEGNAQFAILGSGDDRYRAMLEKAAKEHPGRVGIRSGFDPRLAQWIYAGSDVFLMPSLFEPCGLGQMIAMRYGCVPLVRKTGGLADTVVDADEDAKEGVGFVFSEYSADALLAAMKRALAAFQDADRWHALQVAGMRRDWSWRASAERYEEMYLDALRCVRKAREDDQST